MSALSVVFPPPERITFSFSFPLAGRTWRYLDSLLLSDVITVFNDITGVETSKNITFSYYPKPVTEKLYLNSSESIRTIKVFTINGNLIQSLTFHDECVSIDFSQLKSGIYFLEVNGMQETKENIKIIKQ